MMRRAPIVTAAKCAADLGSGSLEEYRGDENNRQDYLEVREERFH